jgi:hypothetical protein
MHWMITERPRALAIVMLDEDKLADVARGGCAEATSTDRKSRAAAVSLFLSDPASG